jgi:UDP-N-acetylmuramoylalanine--D-glutamate ligase
MEKQRSRSINTYTEYRDMNIAVIGLGVTGLACLRFLLEQGAKVCGFDQKLLNKSELLLSISLGDAHTNLDNKTYDFSAHFDCERLSTDTSFSDFDLIVLSPGVNPSHPAIAPLMGGKKLVSDLDLFARHNHIPCIGVSGSNGKSTVVDMLHKALLASGKKALLGGNFGTSAIDLLNTEADYIVLELSSFQLQISQQIPLAVACILNVTEDHTDRHGSLENYTKAKQRIFENAAWGVFNRDDSATLPQNPSEHVNNRENNKVEMTASVGTTASKPTDNGLDANTATLWQDASGIYIDNTALIQAAELTMPLSHMMLNMQFVLAIVKSLGLPLGPVVNSLKAYQGLAHRFERVREDEQVIYINDSKATNPGACLAALNCAHNLDWNIILIAGGDAKGADLSVLQNTINEHVTLSIVFGKDADKFLPLLTHVKKVENLSQAIELAEQVARQQSTKTVVLLSPSCASTDMFANYKARGDAFRQAVLEMLA